MAAAAPIPADSGLVDAEANREDFGQAPAEGIDLLQFELASSHIPSARKPSAAARCCRSGLFQGHFQILKELA